MRTTQHSQWRTGDFDHMHFVNVAPLFIREYQSFNWSIVNNGNFNLTVEDGTYHNLSGNIILTPRSSATFRTEIAVFMYLLQSDPFSNHTFVAINCLPPCIVILNPEMLFQITKLACCINPISIPY